MFGGKKEEPPLSIITRIRMFLAIHWRGVVAFIAPFAACIVFIQTPVQPHHWCAYCLIVMATYWVTECIPLPVTAFIPMFVFPLTGVMNCYATAKCYVNDTIFIFVASLMLATAVEQSGFHKRLALNSIHLIGYSHYKILFAMCFVTMFVSMWITNAAATTMMVPINFALLKVFEDQKLLRVYDETPDGGKIASSITVCYFCAVAFSSTIGGVGTLIGTATNLVFKGLLESRFPQAPEYITFPKFSMLTVPYMLLLEILLYITMIFQFLGFMRPNSAEAKATTITPKSVEAASLVVNKNLKELGSLTFWEFNVVMLFSLAIALFFARSPQIFQGWGDVLEGNLGVSKFVKDSANAFFVIFLMFLLPSSLMFFKNCTAKVHEHLPKRSILPVLRWYQMDAVLPYSFMFLLGGGFALSTAASDKHTNLNGHIATYLESHLAGLPRPVVLLILINFTVFLTNFASNVAVCTVVAPIGMDLAVKLDRNPLIYATACGLCASFCYMLPVGTPANLIIQSAAKISTGQMIKAGIIPSITTIFLTWVTLLIYAPIVWPDANKALSALPWSGGTTPA